MEKVFDIYGRCHSWVLNISVVQTFMKYKYQLHFNEISFLGEIPVLRGVANDGLCDLRRQNCYRTRVIGKGFIDSADLKCKMTEAKVCSLGFNSRLTYYLFRLFLLLVLKLNKKIIHKLFTFLNVGF